MAQDTGLQKSELKGFMEAMIQSNTHLVRTVLLIIVFFGVVLAGLFWIFSSFTKSAENIKVSMLKSGLLIEVKNPNKAESNYSVSQFLLPSNDIWYDTGMELTPEQEVEFKISGKVHLALKKIVDGVSEDVPMKVKWTDADGDNFADLNETNTQKIAKRKLLLHPGKGKIGNVVCYLQPIDEDITNFKTTFLKNRTKMTEKIISVGTGGNEYIVKNGLKKRFMFFCQSTILYSISQIQMGFD